MSRRALSIGLGIVLMAVGPAAASPIDESDVQAPRTVSHLVTFRGEPDEVQAPRGEPDEVQAPRGVIATQPRPDHGE